LCAEPLANVGEQHLVTGNDEQFLECPWYGSRQMARHLCRRGFSVGRNRIRRSTTIHLSKAANLSHDRGPALLMSVPVQS
jgi:hypothetical protein